MITKQKEIAVFTIKTRVHLTDKFTEDDAYDMILEQLPDGWEIDFHEIEYEQQDFSSTPGADPKGLLWVERQKL